MRPMCRVERERGRRKNSGAQFSLFDPVSQRLAAKPGEDRRRSHTLAPKGTHIVHMHSIR
jgi:hypothetical protein